MLLHINDCHPGRRSWLNMRSLSLLCALVLMISGCATINEQPVTISPPQPRAANETVPKSVHRPTIALALGGGAARGFAHVGVIQVLEEAHVKLDLMTGTSAGSVVAALHASGRNGIELQRIAETMDEATFEDWTLTSINRGVLQGDALAHYVSQQVGGRRIEELPVPLGILATDLRTGEGVLFERGDVATAVRASSAVPGVFHPVSILGRDYVDGGLVAPVPARQARQMGADLIVAVDISEVPSDNVPSGMFNILLQTFTIMSKSINARELQGSNLIIVRPSLNGISATDFSARQQAIQVGRKAMQDALPRLFAAMDEWRK
jgi:NTE family protein